MTVIGIFGVFAAVALALVLILKRKAQGKEKRQMIVRKREFLRRGRSKYKAEVEHWRASEFPQLLRPGSMRGKVYLDYAGSALASKSQLDEERGRAGEILGNPHTIGDEASERARCEALNFWSDKNGDFALIWTSGATESLRLIGQYLASEWTLCYDLDAHTSVVGLRRMASSSSVMTDWDTMSTKEGIVLCLLTLESNVDGRRRCNALLIEKLRKKFQGEELYIGIDASKAGPLVLTDLAGADFIIPPSFYKLFGSPTGLGALLVKKERSLHFLAAKRERGYFGGGALERYSATVTDWEVVKRDLEQAFADGTPHFRGIAALSYGFAEIRRCGGLAAIRDHAASLASELRLSLSQLRHSNDAPVICIYSNIPDSSIVACNVLRSDGSTVSASLVTTLAKAKGIIIRSGCLCNAGRCAELLGLRHDDIVQAWERGSACGSADDINADGRPLGLLRISFGKDSIYEDLDAFFRFIVQTFVTTTNFTNQDLPSKKPRQRVRSRDETTSFRIDDLLVYPVKGCRPMSVASWPILSSGRLWRDREWLVFDRQLGVVATGKTHPRLALLTASIFSDQDELCLSYGDQRLVIDISAQSNSDSASAIRVCGSERACESTEFSSEVSNFLGQLLINTKDPNRFVLMRTATRNQSSFANSAPLLLVTRRAVSKLNRDLRKVGADPVTADHFRANLLVSETIVNEADDEERWSTLLFSKGLRLSALGPCERCATVDLDPNTALRRDGGIVLRTIAKARLEANCRRAKITFGIFLGKPQATAVLADKNTSSREFLIHSSSDYDGAVLTELCRGDSFSVETMTAASE